MTVVKLNWQIVTIAGGGMFALPWEYFLQAEISSHIIKNISEAKKMSKHIKHFYDYFVARVSCTDYLFC
jgi:hypothetical protein